MTSHPRLLRRMQTREERQQAYMLDVAERIDRVLARTGEVPGALAKLFCYNFVVWAKRIGVPRKEAERLLAQTWERFDRAEQTQDIPAIIKAERVQ